MPASAANVAAVNPYGTKTLLANDVSTLLINGKLTFINEPRTLAKNPPSWLLIFSVVPFNKILLFSRDFTTFLIYFISLFVSVTPKPITDEMFY